MVAGGMAVKSSWCVVWEGSGRRATGGTVILFYPLSLNSNVNRTARTGVVAPERDDPPTGFAATASILGEYQPSARATTATATRVAPAARSTLATSLQVAPVVRMSSTSKTRAALK